MEEWKKIQKTYKIRELIGITGMIMSFVIGAICDWNVLVQSNILIPIDDIEAFSLTIIQIQATVGTLIFTIIALITGNISDSYIGVSISDFYLNLKPWKLTQKVLIVVSLGLCLAGVIFHSLGLYNIVFYLFIATLREALWGVTQRKRIKAGVLFSNVKTSFGLYAILGTIWVQQLCNYINKTQNRIKMMRF